MTEDNDTPVPCPHKQCEMLTWFAIRSYSINFVVLTIQMCSMCCILHYKHFSSNFFIVQHKDLLQLMMDACDEDTNEGLSTGQIVANSVEFLLAGYETTSSTLTFTSYLLSANPEVQEKLANEIHDYLDENPVSHLLAIVGIVQLKVAITQ